MWDLIVSVPDHCLSFYFVSDLVIEANTLIHETLRIPFLLIPQRVMLLLEI